MTETPNRRAIRSILQRRRLLELIWDATLRALDKGDCPDCEVEGIAIDLYLHQSGAEFRARHIKVRPDYRRPPLDATPASAVDSRRTE